MSRHDSIFKGLDLKTSAFAEIGALANPIAPPGSVFIDAFTKYENIRLKGITDINLINKMPEIGCIWDGSSRLEPIMPIKCNCIIASHVIEHIANPIRWLKHLSECLATGGWLSLVIPDKRYCFDHFRPLTSPGNLIDAFNNAYARPTLGQVLDMRIYCHRFNGANSWSRHSQISSRDLAPVFEGEFKQELLKDFKRRHDLGEYIDSHCWCFTAESFVFALEQIKSIDLIDFAKLEVDEFDNDFVVRVYW
ncbi:MULTISPECIES: methyltransferase domain-containing protein [Aphanothece]|uniref:methyltransferase domain-containing protein n=1 Tax=Aphanothece TaxID=1121 RepID=UPI0039856AB2